MGNVTHTDFALVSNVAIKSTTMTILVIVFAELLRAYTSRSMRRSIFTVGPFTNKWMQYSVFFAILGTILIATIPGIDKVFGCTPLSGPQWGFAIGVSFIPAFIDELTKLVYRKTGFGERPNAVYAGIK